MCVSDSLVIRFGMFLYRYSEGREVDYDKTKKKRNQALQSILYIKLYTIEEIVVSINSSFSLANQLVAIG